MSRILIAWELGANYGHLPQLAQVAEALRAAGHQVLFAVRDLSGAAEVLAPRGFEFVQAPFFQRRQRTAAAPANHAEILGLEGYGDETSARGMASGWIALARAFRPDAIAAHHAPGALIAGRVLALPQAQVGTGFEIPPLRSPMPAIRPWEAIREERLRGAEEQLVERMNRVLRPFHAPELDTLADWFRTEARIYTTFAELDPFGPRPGERYIGPIYEHETGDTVDWPQGELPRIFAYLRNDIAGGKAILAALAAAAARTICVVPGMPPAAIEKFATDRLRIAARPQRLDTVFPGAQLAVSYGGHGLVCAALAAGIPLVVAPHAVEQYLHARRVESIGAGVVIDGDRSVEAVSNRISRALQDDTLRAGARRFAARYTGFHPARGAAEAAGIIGNIARGTSGAIGRFGADPR